MSRVFSKQPGRMKSASEGEGMRGRHAFVLAAVEAELAKLWLADRRKELTKCHQTIWPTSSGNGGVLSTQVGLDAIMATGRQTCYLNGRVQQTDRSDR